ncbi:YceI family protein [Aequorivita sp. KMM 9714]|uniref:YceI family protein n=1 Tax=Aequorivita sp. KMM 9714 TaxID=2707173 RepID=UPI0013EA2724|nr:YceI family protein [Aequorivita sp. KMM 9714]NGX85073.1 YceI family protein [Aequorivita sp. KMM 9714]
MNRYLPILFSLIFGLYGWSQPEILSKKVQLLASSELSIKGDTNISAFGCDFNIDFLEEFTDVNYQRNKNRITFTNAVLFLQNRGFDCGSRGINKDFHEMLNTKDYPNITLELTDVILNESKNATAIVLITISGIQRGYSLPIQIYSSPSNRFVGSLKLNINDFKLEPPTKLFGLIEIKDEIDINFDLVAEL